MTRSPVARQLIAGGACPESQAYTKMAHDPVRWTEDDDVTLPPSDETHTLFSSGALPNARLMQWINADEAAVDFSVLWASVVVPVASIVDWRMTLIVLLPVVVRLTQRRLALRQLMYDGASPKSIEEALKWVDSHEQPSARYTGWKQQLRRVRSFALVATGSGLLLNSVVTALKPWEFSTTGQNIYAVMVRSLISLVAITSALVVVDAIVSPRPIFGALRAKANGWWRSFISRKYIAPFAKPDAYQLLAEREVALITARVPRR